MDQRAISCRRATGSSPLAFLAMVSRFIGHLACNDSARSERSSTPRRDSTSWPGSRQREDRGTPRRNKAVGPARRVPAQRCTVAPATQRGIWPTSGCLRTLRRIRWLARRVGLAPAERRRDGLLGVAANGETSVERVPQPTHDPLQVGGISHAKGMIGGSHQVLGRVGATQKGEP